MDIERFDTLTRAFGATPSRRRLVTAIAASLLGVMLDDAPGTGVLARNRRRRKGKGKNKKNKACRNGVLDGNESDIDCGDGRCPRCVNGRQCRDRGDCAGALCTGGACQACTVNTDCGNDGNGACVCIQPGDAGPFICVTDRYTGPFPSCASCPKQTFCYISNPGEIYCYQRLCGVT